MRSFHCWLQPLIVIWMVLLSAIVAPMQVMGQAVSDQIGLTQLRDRLGASTPTGAGVPLMLVEGQVALNAYLPDANIPEFAGKLITDRSGGGVNSTHATSVATIGFGGLTGIAPGVSRMDVFKVDFTISGGDWFGPLYLNLQGELPAEMSDLRLQNHSWAAGVIFDANTVESIRRFDYAIARDNVVSVVGISNTTGSQVPPLLGHAFNAIAVGNSNGASSYGPTLGEGTGRSKPDIVGPYGVSSYSTPTVSACAAILMETGDLLGNPNRTRMETIKSVLLTGATKQEFMQLATPWIRINNGAFVEPLDRRFGAGEVNVNNSHLILSQPESNGTTLTLQSTLGWDYEALTATDNTRRYFFETGDVTDLVFTATVTWLRHITPTGTGNNLFATSETLLSKLEMRLYEATVDFSLGLLIDSSLSPVDNLQHLYRTDLIPNQRYALEVQLINLPAGVTSENMAVSWFTSFTAVPEPAGILLATAVAGIVLAAAWYHRLQSRKLSDADC